MPKDIRISYKFEGSFAVELQIIRNTKLYWTNAFSNIMFC